MSLLVPYTIKKFVHDWISKIISYILCFMLIGCSLTSSFTPFLSTISLFKSCFPMFFLTLISMTKTISLSRTTLSRNTTISKIVICWSKICTGSKLYIFNYPAIWFCAKLIRKIKAKALRNTTANVEMEVENLSR